MKEERVGVEKNIY